jgi:hypothetical protein
MMAACVLVLATEHLQRDEWVDEQARLSPPGEFVPVENETYQGVWILPLPECTPAHVFANPEDLARLVEQGFKKAAWQ